MESFLFGFSGTTEKIFEEKKELYDVYIDNQNVKTHRESLQPLLRLNNADREKYRKLCEQRYVSLLKPQSIWGEKTWKHCSTGMWWCWYLCRQLLLYSQEVDGDCTSNEEDLFILYVMELHNSAQWWKFSHNETERKFERTHFTFCENSLTFFNLD